METSPSAGGEQMYAKFTVINLLGIVTVAFEQEKISLLYHIPAAKGASVFVVPSKGPSHLLIPSTTN